MYDRRRFIASVGVLGAARLWLPGSSEAAGVAADLYAPSRVQLRSANEIPPSAKASNVYWELLAGPRPMQHYPLDRGRRIGPNNSWWYDLGRHTNGHIMYGPYVELPRGRYHYWFHLKYDIPGCGADDDRGLFHLDAARRVGETVGNIIAGSGATATWRWFCNSEQNDGGMFDALVGSEFELTETTPGVEIRLRQAAKSTTAVSLECVVKNAYLYQL
jgi:hypothetical protein